MSSLSAVKRVLVPSKVISAGHDVLRAAGRAYLEGMVLWAGILTETTFQVTRLIVPKQRGIRTHDGVCVVVDGDELHRLNVHLFENQLMLIAQLHSHPGCAYHSDTDDTYAVATNIGCFSLVIPDFAVRSFSLNECAVYRLRASGSWDEVDPSQLPNQLVIESN